MSQLSLSDSEGPHDALCVCACVPSRNTTIQTLMGNPTTSAYTRPNPVLIHSGLLQSSMMHNLFQKDPPRDALMCPWSHGAGSAFQLTQIQRSSSHQPLAQYTTLLSLFLVQSKLQLPVCP